MKTVITGSHGFVGSHLVNLIKDKSEIITLSHDLLSDCEAIKYRLRDGFDYLFHLAAYGNYYDQQDDFQTIESNVLYLHNLLQATKDIQYQGFINMSTSSVYGAKLKALDELDRLDPTTMYAATKAAGEHICKAHSLKYNKPIINIRPFTIYGPGDNPKHLIPTVIEKIKNEELLELDPSPVHDYIYVKDLVEALWLFKNKSKEYNDLSINLGNGLQFNNLKVVELIEEIMGKKANKTTKEHVRSYDSTYWKADNTIARSLGYSPKYTLHQGLMEIINGE